MNRNLKNFHRKLGQGLKPRSEDKLDPRGPVRILIVCEGEKTEPNYFNKFNVDKKKALVDVVGIGYVSKFGGRSLEDAKGRAKARDSFSSGLVRVRP